MGSQFQTANLDQYMMDNMTFDVEKKAWRVSVIDGVTLNVDNINLPDGALQPSTEKIQVVKVPEIIKQNDVQVHQVNVPVIIKEVEKVDVPFPVQEVKIVEVERIVKEVQRVEVPVIIKEYEKIEVPVVVKEIEYKTVEIPITVKEMVYNTVEIPVIVKEVQVVEVEKPVIVKQIEYKELPRYVKVCIFLQAVSTLGLFFVRFFKG